MAALHDTDFNNADRGSPMPAGHDVLDATQRSAHGTQSFNPVTDATPTTAFFQTKNARALVNDGIANRILIGAEPDGSFGMKVSVPGFDVLDTDDSHIIFDSNRNIFKIVQVGSTPLTPTNGGSPNYTVSRGNSTSVTITHGLGYIPFVGAFAVTPVGSPIGNNVTSIPYTSYLTGLGNWGLSQLRIYYTLTSQTLTFYIEHFKDLSYANFPTYQITYYLLQQTAN